MRRRYRTYPVSQPGSVLKPLLAYPERLRASLRVFDCFRSIFATTLEIIFHQSVCKNALTGVEYHNAWHISLLGLGLAASMS